MKQLFILSFILIAALTAFAQTKTITNADLEKYKQERLKAEREYRENYVRLGFPSPEELARRNEQSQRELSEYSSRLRQERLAEEYSNSLQNQTNYTPTAPQYYPQNNRTLYFGYSQPYGYYNYNYYRPRPNRFPNSEYINRLRETDFINRRNGYNSPFQPQNNPHPNFPIRGGKRY
jgi:hypothetical protein